MVSTHRRRPRQCIRLRVGRHAVVLAMAVLALQALSPPGYMPGSLAGGWPVVLCPEGLPTGWLHDLAPAETHAHHAAAAQPDSLPAPHDTDHDAGMQLDMLAYCPLGSVLDGTVLAVRPLAVAPGQRPTARSPAPGTSRVQQPPAWRALARGPPALV
jgi:hypothetical protein